VAGLPRVQDIRGEPKERGIGGGHLHQEQGQDHQAIRELPSRQVTDKTSSQMIKKYLKKFFL